MSMSLEVTDQPFARASKAVRPRKKHGYKMLIAAWVFLIACGVVSAKLYSDYMRRQIASQIAEQTKQQLDAIAADYQTQVNELKTSMASDMSKLQTKVDSLSELLAFAKDSANNKTDNSNQLYTQLADVKKKLDELQKNLDVLK